MGHIEFAVCGVFRRLENMVDILFKIKLLLLCNKYLCTKYMSLNIFASLRIDETNKGPASDREEKGAQKGRER